MNAHIRLAYQKTRHRSIWHVESELAEAKASMDRAARGTYAYEYAEARVAKLNAEHRRMKAQILKGPQQ